VGIDLEQLACVHSTPAGFSSCTFVGPVAHAIAMKFFLSFKEFPPQQEASTINLDVMLQQLSAKP